MLHRANQFLPPDVVLSLYYAFVLPYLSYCCTVWGNTNYSSLRQLRTAQNRAVKATFRLPRLYPTADLYSDTGLDTLDVLIKKQNLKLAHRAFNFSLPPNILSYFDLATTRKCQTLLRSSVHQFRLPKRVSSAAQRSPIYRAIALWNSIPSELSLIKNSSSLCRKIFSKAWSNFVFFLYFFIHALSIFSALLYVVFFFSPLLLCWMRLEPRCLIILLMVWNFNKLQDIFNLDEIKSKVIV